jgi:hypothetical protein
LNQAAAGLDSLALASAPSKRIAAKALLKRRLDPLATNHQSAVTHRLPKTAGGDGVPIRLVAANDLMVKESEKLSLSLALVAIPSVLAGSSYHGSPWPVRSGSSAPCYFGQLRSVLPFPSCC